VVARRSKKSDTEFIPTPDRQMEMPSGFCMTGHHHDCKYTFISGKCGCDCHTQTPKTQIVREEVAFIADSTIDDTIIDVTNEELIVIEDPRPWIKK
jgi:hypothetical protein